MVAIAPPRTTAGDRASIVAFGLVAAAFVATLASPLWLLLLAPLVLGAPHIASDLRYLVLHGPRRLRPGAIIAVTVPLALMIALRAGAIAGGAVQLQLEVGLGCAAVAGAALYARRSPAVIAALIAVAVPAIAAPRAAMLVLLHGHNIVAFVIWLRWTRGGPARAPLVAIAIAGAALIGLGAFDAILPHGGPLDATALAQAFAPGLGPIAGGRIVLLYAFAQALHYAVWLYLIPRSCRTASSLLQDFGPVGCALIAAAVLAVPLCAALGDAAHVRDIYLALVMFHAWLELAIIAHLIAARDRLETA